MAPARPPCTRARSTPGVDHGGNDRAACCTTSSTTTARTPPSPPWSNRTELWFVPVANPDGYDYTFTRTENRLWRKNLADNNGDGQITAGDGVDPNRNFSYKWGWDNEGSSPDPSSETYRGPAPNSEPETKALDGLFRRVGFEFLINYHSAAELLLYGVGWQVSTPTPDDEILKTMAGDDADPAVPGYDPDISAELYTTNGETDTHATVRYGTLAFTPKMTTCQTVSASDPNDEWEPEDCASGFNFPDDEDLIQAEFAKNIPFALAVGRSAPDPDDPVSVVGDSWTSWSTVPGVSSGTDTLQHRSAVGPERCVDALLGERRWDPLGRRPGVEGAVNGTATPTTSTTPSCAARSPAPRPATRLRCGSAAVSGEDRSDQRPLHLQGAERHRRRCADPRPGGRDGAQPGASGHECEVRRRDGAAL